MTNFEKITYDIETDGTMAPKEALTRAANVLIDHFAILTEEGLEAAKRAKESMLKKIEEEEKAKQAEAEALLKAEEERKQAEEEREQEKPKRKRGRPRKTEVEPAASPEEKS